MEAAVRQREEDHNEEDRCPQAGQEEEEEEGDEEEALHLAKRRKVMCSEFAAITSSDAAVARRFLADNDWQIQVGLGAAAGGRTRGCPGGGGGPFPDICLCVSEGAECLFRAAAGEGGGGGAAGWHGARHLVGDPRGGGGVRVSLCLSVCVCVSATAWRVVVSPLGSSGPLSA